MIVHILIGLGAVSGYVLLVLALPVITCPRCRGKRVRRVGNRGMPCRICKATGITRPPGATVIHATFWSVFGDRIHDRQREQAAERTATRKEAS
jgi:hypothetical protein